MSTEIQFENSMQQMKSYKNLYQNPLELELRRNPQPVDYTLKLIDIYPVYCLKGQKHICYRKILKSEQQYSMVQEHINSSTYKWKENVYHNTISLYYFMSISKGQEWIVPYALRKGIENNYLWWEIWGVLEDRTILSPSETKKIIRLLQDNAIKFNSNSHGNMKDFDEYEARKTYIDSLAEGDSNVR